MVRGEFELSICVQRRFRRGRTLIRKTSLLHKTDPTALRSSFADMSIAGASIPSRLASREILLLEMPGVAHRP
jgi:hypothetical protein